MIATKFLTPTLSKMVVITEVPDLPSVDIQMMFQLMNIYLNELILWAFCNGMISPTSSVVQASSNLEQEYILGSLLSHCGLFVISAKDMNRGIASYTMVFVILFLYGLDTLTIAFSWSLGSYVFIGNGWNFWTVFLALVISTPPSMKAQWA
ncbi:hypothetical protein ARMGADRAFT_1038165, partial [Armillaria gallica]